MQKNNIQNIIEIITKNGVIGILALVLWWYGSAIDTRLNEFNKHLDEIGKEIVEIKIELTTMRATYIDKDETRKIVDEKIKEHEQRYHGKL